MVREKENTGKVKDKKKNEEKGNDRNKKKEGRNRWLKKRKTWARPRIRRRMRRKHTTKIGGKMEGEPDERGGKLKRK